MAMVTLPELLNHPEYPNDVKEKARRILADCKGQSVGEFRPKLNFCLNFKLLDVLNI